MATISRRRFITTASMMGVVALAGFVMPGCAGSGASSSASGSASSSDAVSTSAASAAAAPRILVTCFSATGNTRPLAKAAAESLGADYFEIEPADPYTDDDLNYHDSSTRATVEQNSPETRPALAQQPDFSAYDVVLVGHPIWWGKAPRLICAMLENGNLSGKKIAEFCTSGGSGVDGAYAELKELVPDAQWIDAHRFAADAPGGEVAAWTASLGL